MAEAAQLLAAWADLGDDEARWAMMRPGPSADAVATRLSAVPQMFLDARVSPLALAADAGLPGLGCLRFADDERVRRAVGIGLWVVASEELVAPLQPSLRTGAAASGIDALALRVAAVVDPRDWLVDDARRDEAVRFFLFGCGFAPAGEDPTTAGALLGAADSLARNEVLNAAYIEHRHRADRRRALNEARAREAAARYSHE